MLRAIVVAIGSLAFTLCSAYSQGTTRKHAYKERVEYQNKYLKLGTSTRQVDGVIQRADSSCALEGAIKEYEKKEDIHAQARILQALVLLKSKELREALPQISTDDLNLYQRNILRKRMENRKGLQQNFLLLDNLKSIELALGNSKAYESLLSQIQKFHGNSMKTDLICYKFMHQSFEISKAVNAKQDSAKLRSLHAECQRSESIGYFKKEASKRYKCLEHLGRPFISYSEYEKLYRSGAC